MKSTIVIEFLLIVSVKFVLSGQLIHNGDAETSLSLPQSKVGFQFMNNSPSPNIRYQRDRSFGHEKDSTEKIGQRLFNGTKTR